MQRTSRKNNLHRLRIPEVWTPRDLDGSFLGMLHHGNVAGPGSNIEEENNPEMMGTPSEVVPDARDVIREQEGGEAEELGSEDDVDMEGKYFLSINRRTGHRKLHIFGRCGTKPGQNFSAYEPLNHLKGVGYNSYCGHCWKGKTPEESPSESSSTSSEDS